MQVDHPTRPPYSDITARSTRQNRARQECLQLGLWGQPLFNKLSYFKCVPRLASYHHTLHGQRNLAASVDCRTFRVL